MTHPRPHPRYLAEAVFELADPVPPYLRGFVPRDHTFEDAERYLGLEPGTVTYTPGDDAEGYPQPSFEIRFYPDGSVLAVTPENFLPCPSVSTFANAWDVELTFGEDHGWEFIPRPDHFWKCAECGHRHYAGEGRWAICPLGPDCRCLGQGTCHEGHTAPLREDGIGHLVNIVCERCYPSRRPA